MNDWTSNEAREFLSIIRGEAEKVVKDLGNRQSSIYACLAVVTDVSESGAISVRLLSSPVDGSQDFVVPNQSGSVIEVGDSVWLHYWGDYTNVYIGIRNGSDSVPISTGLTQTQVVNLVYPVGAIYMSVVSTSPASLFGGTWAAWGAGRVPVGVNTSDTNFNTVEKTGGSSTHTLTSTEMPSHTHTQNAHNHGYRLNLKHTDGDIVNGEYVNENLAGGSCRRRYSDITEYSTATNQNTGGGGAHNNLQPYITCYMWKRTA